MYQFPDTTLCAGQNIQIPLAGFPSGLEVFMNGTNQSDMMQLEQAGSYFIRFEQDKCVGYDTIHLDYFPPIPSNMTDSIDFCSIQNRLLEVPLDTPYSYFWEGTMLTYDEVYIDTAGEYELLITDSSGCELAKSIHIYDCACKLYFPNAITINEDNKNEQFIGSGCSTVSSYRLLIYNRWGELLFESTNPMEAWDGTYKGRVCAEGVYLYLVSYNNQAQTGAPSRFHEKGTLTILR